MLSHPYHPTPSHALPCPPRASPMPLPIPLPTPLPPFPPWLLRHARGHPGAGLSLAAALLWLCLLSPSPSPLSCSTRAPTGEERRTEEIVGKIYVRLLTEPEGAKHPVPLAHTRRKGEKTSQVNGTYKRTKLFLTAPGPKVGDIFGAGGQLVCVERFSWGAP